MGKLKTRLLQAKYYVLASVCASAVFGGLSVVGKKVEVNDNVTTRCFAGDTGEGNEGQALVAQAMKDSGCEEFYHTGDAIYNIGIKDAKDKKFKTHFWNLYEDFGKVIVTLGNHDQVGNVDAWIELAKKYSSLIYPNHFYLYKSDDFCTAVWMSEPVERDDDNDFVKAQDAYFSKLDLSGCKTTVAMAHHPYRSAGNHGDCMKHVCEFYERNILGKFNYAVVGHDHQLSYEGNFKGTDLYVSGAGAKLRECKKNKDKTCFEKLGFLKFIGHEKPEWVFVNENN